ncbi:MAG: fumarylacetoacetate hydrolase family protein [Acidobacteria bacterium]|nr:fumarylacetoacetate hydrolase family protein [Acidobacteriota bacterium]
MILLTAMTSAGPRLAVKTTAGIVVLEKLQNSKVPLTLGEALTSPGGLDAVRAAVGSLLKDADALKKHAVPESQIKIGVPFAPRNVLCIGLNYKDHAEESNTPLPERPVVFAKLTSAIIAHGEAIVLPPDTKEVDYEAEFAVVIGRRCRGVSPKDALDYVAGYTCLNDVSARDFQRGDGQWVRAKSQDTFGPMGPYVVTSEDVPDPQKLPIRCLVNGQKLQDSNTDKMIFGVRELIAFISRGITLEPGDVISTGTPHGVGFARKPPVFLKAGDEVVVEIDGIGRLSNPVKG